MSASIVSADGVRTPQTVGICLCACVRVCTVCSACVRDLPELSMNLWPLACREGSGTGRQSALLLLGREPDVEHIRPATARAQVFVCACSATLNVLQLLASALSLVLCLAAFFCFLSSRRHASNLSDSM